MQLPALDESDLTTPEWADELDEAMQHLFAAEKARCLAGLDVLEELAIIIAALEDLEHNVRENRIRSAVQRRGYLLQESRRSFQIVDPTSNTVVVAMDWEAVEAWLLRETAGGR
jgi:hypothetical protein